MPTDSRYEVRLNTTVKTPLSGILEVLIDGCWRPVCDTLSVEALNVICKQLGHKEALIPFLHYWFITEGFECDGDEENLAECPHNRHRLTERICVAETRTTVHCTREDHGGANFKCLP